MIEISTQDLLTRLTREELDELTATALEDGQADPVEAAIEGALGEIKLAVDPASLPDETLRRLWLSLAIPLCYPRRAVVPDKHAKEQTWARDTLKDIRSGEYSTLQPDGVWGSETKAKWRDR